MSKQMDHAEYEAKVTTMSDSALLFTIQDAKEAVDAMPFGENAGYYTDEMHYCAAELRNRSIK